MSSISLIYPSQVFTALLLIYHENNIQNAFIPLETFSQLNSTCRYLGQIAQEFIARRPLAEISTQTIIAQLELHRTLPLRPNLRQRPFLRFDSNNRLRQMLHMFESPEFFHLLVTPLKDKAGRLHYQSACPFYRSGENDLDNFLHLSDWEVAKSTTHVALYQPVRVFGYDWTSGQELPLQPPALNGIVH